MFKAWGFKRNQQLCKTSLCALYSLSQSALVSNVGSFTYVKLRKNLNNLIEGRSKEKERE